MSELISGKEALIALANGENIQAQYKDHAKENCWFDILKTDQLSIFDRDDLNFRLKPITISVNGRTITKPKSAISDGKIVKIEFYSETNAHDFMEALRNAT